MQKLISFEQLLEQMKKLDQEITIEISKPRDEISQSKIQQLIQEKNQLIDLMSSLTKKMSDTSKQLIQNVR